MIAINMHNSVKRKMAPFIYKTLKIKFEPVIMHIKILNRKKNFKKKKKKEKVKQILTMNFKKKMN